MSLYSPNHLPNTKQSLFFCEVTNQIKITIENKHWNITKQVFLEYIVTKLEIFDVSENVKFTLGIRLNKSTITVASLHNGTKHPVRSWECREKIPRESHNCNGSDVKWTKAYSCGSNINWCWKLRKDLQWVWQSNFTNTSHIWCRRITGRSNIKKKHFTDS